MNDVIQKLLFVRKFCKYEDTECEGVVAVIPYLPPEEQISFVLFNIYICNSFSPRNCLLIRNGVMTGDPCATVQRILPKQKHK